MTGTTPRSHFLKTALMCSCFSSLIFNSIPVWMVSWRIIWYGTFPGCGQSDGWNWITSGTWLFLRADSRVEFLAYAHTESRSQTDFFCLCAYGSIFIIIKSEIKGICVHLKSLPLHPTLCNTVDYSPPGSSVHGILQARILEWVTMPFSRGSSPPRDRTHISYNACIGRWVLYH